MRAQCLHLTSSIDDSGAENTSEHEGWLNHKLYGAAERRARGVRLLQRRWRARGGPLPELLAGLLRDVVPGRLCGLDRAVRLLAHSRLFNLRMDPFKSADIVSDQYDDWRSKNSFLIMQVNCRAMAFLKTFAEYPPSQESQSFTITQAQRDIEVQIKAKAGK